MARIFSLGAGARLLRSRLAGNVLSLYAIQGLNALLPLVTLPFLLRALQPAGYGTIMFAQSLMGYALLVVEFGFNFTAAREISVARDKPDEIARIYWTTLAAKSLLMVASATAVAFIVLATPSFRSDWSVFAASGLLLVGNVVFPQWYFQGLERLREAAATQAVARIAAALGVITLVRAPDDRVIAAMILSGPQLLALAAALVLRQPLAPERFHRPSLSEIRQALARSAHLFAASISTTLYLHTNTLVLGIMRGPEAVALYSLANRIIGAMQGLVTPVSQALFPRASLLFAENPAQAWRLLRNVVRVMLPAVALASVALGIFAPTAVNLLGGAAFTGVVPVLRIMLIVPVLVTAATFLAQTVMANVGLGPQLFRIYLTVGLLNLALLPALIHFYDTRGAALALVVAETLGPILMAAVVWRWARSHWAPA
jgi:polysaccharide transporter, PST family